MKRIFYILACFLLTEAVCLGGNPNSWHGLTIDISTSGDAVSILGEADEVEDNQKIRSIWSTNFDNSQRFTTLGYNSKFELVKVVLYFSQDDTEAETLRAIRLDLLKPVNPNELSEFYEILFYSTVPESIREEYPEQYHIAAKSDSVLIDASIGTYVDGYRPYRAYDSHLDLPGWADQIWLISRKFENPSRLNVLE